jgi:hypothetical protein
VDSGDALFNSARRLQAQSSATEYPTDTLLLNTAANFYCLLLRELQKVGTQTPLGCFLACAKKTRTDG